LPITNEHWYTKILSAIQQVNNSYIKGVSCKAAHLFYYIIKDHHFPDGNKRSGIAIAYLFFLLNGYEIRSGERVRMLAKNVAKSHGSKQKDNWIAKIEKEFSYLCKSIS
jgi:death-on-curing family protein